MTVGGPGGPGMESGANGYLGRPADSAAQPGGMDPGEYPSRAGGNSTAEPGAGPRLRQRVIVVSPFGRHQVDLPADLPVADFLPDLLAGVGLYPRQGGSAGSGWQLQAADGRVLAPDATLPAQGIPPGAVLWLRGGTRADGSQAGARPAVPYQTGGQPSGYQPGHPAAEPPVTEHPATGHQAGGNQASNDPVSEYPASSYYGAQQTGGNQTGAQQPGGHLPTGNQPGGRPSGGHRAAGNQARGHRAGRGRASGAPGRAARAQRPGPPTETSGRGMDRPAADRGTDRASGPDQPRWPSQTPLPPATPMSGDDGLTPLERTEAVLPSPVPRARRLMAAAEVLLKRPQSPEGVIAVGPGTEPTAAHPPSRAGELAGQAAEAPEPTGPLHLIPTDLTVAAAPTRTERVRSVWRDLDHVGQLDARIARPRLHQCATVAVVSPKGGVGKTTVVALLGTLFSLLRRDPVVAVDTNPDFGSLGRVLTPDQSWYVDDLARLVAEEDELSLTALESRLGRAVHGLLVVPAPTDPARMAALDERAYRRVVTRLKDFFSVILLDCGTGLQDPASAASIAAADHVVLVTDAQPATASLVAESATLLLHSGRPMSVVVNRMPARGTRLDLARLSQYIPAARGLVVVPDEISAAARLATGSFNWRDAPPSWQRSLRELAVVIAADWQRQGLAR